MVLWERWANTGINNNYVCFNGYTTGIVNDGTGTTGNGNTCNTTSGYQDSTTGATNCSYACSAVAPAPTCGCFSGTHNYTCGEIVNESCTLNCNLNSTGTCFTVGANDIVINGNGYNITGDGGFVDYGIYANGRNNLTIKNFKIYNFSYGIYLSSSSNNTITNNTANSNAVYGIYLYSSSNNTITNNTANSNTNNAAGIRLDSSSNNVITNNIANLNDYSGINLDSSSNNTITNNIATSNRAAGIYLSSSSNNTITNNTAKLNYNGIWLQDSSNNNTITNNTANSNNAVGIYLRDSSNNNTITNNTVNSNSKSGIYITSSNFNKILNNTILNNNETGITISNCLLGGDCYNGNSNNTIEENVIKNNKIGIFSNASNSTISSNIVCGNTNLDFSSSDWLSSSGDNNICFKPDRWNDTGTIGCTLTCQQYLCDLNHDGIYFQDRDDLMSTYKCFLGFERNCNTIHMQEWNLMKKEYDCFTGDFN